MFQELFDYFGSANRFAGALDVTTQAVVHWQKRGIPARVAIQIEQITGGRFKAIDLTGKPK